MLASEARQIIPVSHLSIVGRANIVLKSIYSNIRTSARLGETSIEFRPEEFGFLLSDEIGAILTILRTNGFNVFGTIDNHRTYFIVEW